MCEVIKLQVVFAELASIGVLVALVAVGLTLDALVPFQVVSFDARKTAVGGILTGQARFLALLTVDIVRPYVPLASYITAAASIL